ncbi:MAG TPA: glycosyltransferase [Bryobacteraceae bacterium]|jgi:glycosyltransferase involved in cell wall biosynthesis
MPRALFLSPEPPIAGAGGGGLRSASLLAFLRTKFEVDVVDFTLREHSKSTPARVWRNAARLGRGVPPLFDRYSGYERQLASKLAAKKYALGIVEHFWCASYAPLLRQHCDRLALDLHNIESELAQTHARAARWPASWASSRFAEAYRRLEKEWLPRFDTLLVTSEQDRARVTHPHVIVYPNALPAIAEPHVPEEHCIVFSGNLEYHPNIEAVRWFRANVWPRVRSTGVEWRLVGRNPEAIASLVSGDDSIKLIGPVDDAVAELARAKVCIVPLLSGSGTRFKILEAWAAKRAVVSTTLGAEGLGARNDEHLLIADNPEKFVAQIEQLLGDTARRERLGAAARELYLKQFTWPVAWRALECFT